MRIKNLLSLIFRDRNIVDKITIEKLGVGISFLSVFISLSIVLIFDYLRDDLKSNILFFDLVAITLPTCFIIYYFSYNSDELRHHSSRSYWFNCFVVILYVYRIIIKVLQIIIFPLLIKSIFIHGTSSTETYDKHVSSHSLLNVVSIMLMIVAIDMLIQSFRYFFGSILTVKLVVYDDNRPEVIVSPIVLRKEVDSIRTRRSFYRDTDSDIDNDTYPFYIIDITLQEENAIEMVTRTIKVPNSDNIEDGCYSNSYEFYPNNTTNVDFRFRHRIVHISSLIDFRRFVIGFLLALISTDLDKILHSFYRSDANTVEKYVMMCVYTIISHITIVFITYSCMCISQVLPCISSDRMNLNTRLNTLQSWKKSRTYIHPYPLNYESYMFCMQFAEDIFLFAIFMFIDSALSHYLVGNRDRYLLILIVPIVYAWIKMIDVFLRDKKDIVFGSKLQ